MTRRTGSARDEPAFATARKVCQKSDPLFFLSCLVLPHDQRDAVCAVQAFLKLMRDTIVGDDASAACCAGGSPDRTEMFQSRLNDIYAGGLELPLPEFRTPPQLVLHAADLTIRKYDIPQTCFNDLLAGRDADVRTLRYATWNALEKHCVQTGGAAGRALACICGMTHSDGAAMASQLGVATRFIRILRDVGADLHGRRCIYLPLEDMARFGYSERDLVGARVNAAFGDLMEFEIARAREMLSAVQTSIRWLADERSRIWASILAAGHWATLDAIEARPRDVLAVRPSINFGRIIRRLPTVWRLARGPTAACGY